MKKLSSFEKRAIQKAIEGIEEGRYQASCNPVGAYGGLDLRIDYGDFYGFDHRKRVFLSKEYNVSTATERVKNIRLLMLELFLAANS